MLLIDKYAYTNKLTDKNPYIKAIFSILFLILSLTIENRIFQISIITIMSITIISTSKMGDK